MLAALLAAALAAAPPTPAPAPDPAAVALAAAAATYPITLQKAESYAAAVRMLREAAAKDPAVALPFRSGARFASLEDSARRVEASPPVKSILDHHGITGRDFVLVPTVLLSSRAAALAEQGGLGAPPVGTNAAGVALWKAHGPRLERLVEAILGDVQRLGGP